MVTQRTMGIILSYSVPMIRENLSSIDFLNNHVQKIDGKVPFFDDMQGFLAADPAQKKWVEKRPTIHMKDQWRVDVSAKGDTGYVYLTNDKKTADGKWIIADLLWYGTVLTASANRPRTSRHSYPQYRAWGRLSTPHSNSGGSTGPGAGTART